MHKAQTMFVMTSVSLLRNINYYTILDVGGMEYDMSKFCTIVYVGVARPV